MVNVALIVKTMRLGKRVDNKIRPLLITINSLEDVSNVLRNYRTKNNIYVNRDLTVRQRNLAYTVRSEFKRRKDGGENDIKLKYTNGMPKIVKN